MFWDSEHLFSELQTPQRSKTQVREPAGDLAEGEEGGVGEIAAESYEDE